MINGKKVAIRQMEMGDERYLHKWRNDAAGNEYSGYIYGFLFSKEIYRVEIMRQVDNAEAFPEEKMFMICRKEDMQPIGDISYRHWDKRNRSVEFGIEIGELQDRGKGYGFDALYHFIDFLFRFLNVNRVELTTLADNLPAQRLYEKLGFKKAGLMREKSFDSRTGGYTDVLIMDLLLKEWNEIRERISISKDILHA